MQSPKFRYTLDDLKGCITPATIKLQWQKNVGAQLRGQLIFDLLDFRDYSDRIAVIAEQLCQEIADGDYQVSPTRHFLAEKSRGLCRQMTVAAPRDLLVLQCLSARLYAQIKASQPTKNAFFEPGKAKFNKDKTLIQPNEYGSYASWKRFQEAIFDFSIEHEFIVVTDVANFYDFINFDHLRNIIASLDKVSESIVDFLIYVLDALAWHPDFMPSKRIGLPQMEADAPRVLANSMLYELDRVANDQAFGDYARFMDDIDVGVDSIPEAKEVVRDIDLTLQSRQLRLNASKTKILRTSNGEAADHFCIRENRFLDFCAHALDEHGSAAHSYVRKALLKAYEIWRGNDKFDPSRFTRGNGEKIFKRTLSLLLRVNGNIPADDAVWLIQNAPALRQACFNALTRHIHPQKQFYRLVDLFRRGNFVDDESYVLMASFVVHARLIRNKKTLLALSTLIEKYLNTGGYFKAYAAIIVSSKVSTPAELLDVIVRTRKYWERDLWMARAVAGLSPLIRRSPKVYKEYHKLCTGVANPEWASVNGFHADLRTALAAPKALQTYVKSKNTSYAFGLFHPKALIILSLSQNKSCVALMKSVHSVHPVLKTDAFYKRWFK